MHRFLFRYTICSFQFSFITGLPVASELFRVSLYQETLYSKWATRWVRSAKRITRINCSNSTVPYVNEQLDQWNSTVFLINTTALWKNSVLKSKLLGNNILAFRFNFCIDFIDFIYFLFLSSFVRAIIVIAYLVINLLMPYVDVYTEAVVNSSNK